MIILKDKAIEAENPLPVVLALQGWLTSLDATEQQKEYFFVLLLDSRVRVKLIDVVSVGTLNGSLVHPREVFVRAIQAHAASIIISHNHPSGCNGPSDADIAITQRLKEAGKILGIDLLDHIVLGGHTYYSFVEHGLL